MSQWILKVTCESRLVFYTSFLIKVFHIKKRIEKGDGAILLI